MPDEKTTEKVGANESSKTVEPRPAVGDRDGRGDSVVLPGYTKQNRPGGGITD